VKRYADLRSVIKDAAATYAQEVADGIYPAPEHSFE
jgi:3-methyl-2-oxobutanoate hydroxymethyltransferase